MLKTNYFNIKFHTEYVTISTIVLRIKAISKCFKKSLNYAFYHLL